MTRTPLYGREVPAVYTKGRTGMRKNSVTRIAASALKNKSTGVSLPEGNGAPMPAVTGCVPVGACVLVELLTPQEMAGTSLYMPDKTKDKECQQAYVIALGPKVDKELGFKVGDRVMLQGIYANPVPDYGVAGRKRNLVEPHMIKAVLTEEATTEE